MAATLAASLDPMGPVLAVLEYLFHLGVRPPPYAGLMTSSATITLASGLLQELLAVVELGPVEASTVAAEVRRDEDEIRRLLDDQVRRDRMKASHRPMRYELTARGCRDLATERLIYGVLSEFIFGDAVSIAGISDGVATSLGLTRRDLGEAAGSAMVEHWIAPAGPGGAYLASTPTGRQAWASAAAGWPRFLAPLAGRHRTTA